MFQKAQLVESFQPNAPVEFGQVPPQRQKDVPWLENGKFNAECILKKSN
jgi:hypothetical protein